MDRPPSPTTQQWNSRFSAPGYAYGTEPNDYLAQVAPRLAPGSRVLSLGEGEGRNAVFLATLGHRVTAVDGSEVGRDKALKLAAERGVALDYVVSDLADYAIAPDTWDAVVSIFCHLPSPLRERVHRAAAAGLRKGGLLVLEGYRPAQLAFKTGGPPVLELLYTPGLLREDFAGLALERLEEVERDVVEGRLHTGRAAVVQLLGRREA